MSNTQNQKPALMIGLVLALVGAGAGGYFALASSPAPEVISVQTPSAVAPPAAAPDAAPSRASAPVRDPSARAPRPTGQGREDKPKPNRLARDLEREQIWSALGRKHELEPAAPGSAAPSESAAERLPALDPNYVREAIKDQLVPVAVDCYDTMLAQDPQLGGKLFFKFTIIGDEEIGGVVEEVELTEDSTLDSEFLRECLGESLLAVTFPPPPEGGRIEVNYPMTFEPE